MIAVTATRYHDISCGHRVFGHESKCAHLHGHNYRVTFTCAAAEYEAAQVDDIGRVIDFSVIKAKLAMWLEDNWDHKFLVWREDDLEAMLAQLDPEGVVTTIFNPTAENMAEYILTVVGPLQLEGTGVKLISVIVEETRKCSATASLGRLR